jgi:integrase
LQIADALKLRKYGPDKKEYTRVANSRLTPILGKKKLEKLTPLDLETAIRQIRLEHSPSEARRTHTIAGIALKQALRWQLVPRNIKEAVTAPKVVRKEMSPPKP